MLMSPIEPAAVTFEEAIALTQSMLSQIEAGKLSPTETATALAALVKSENGARGFFVTYLTDSRSLADNPSSAVVQALRCAPEIVAELLVKNLAMSAAMAVTHRRHQNEAMANQSERVQLRTMRLIELVDIPYVQELSQRLWDSVTGGEGSYKAFLERWGYDAEQLQVIQQALVPVIKVHD